jgi:hypothetical protein
MFVIHKLFAFNKTSEEIKTTLEEIKSWDGDSIFYKIESLGERLLEKCISNKTDNLLTMIENNMELW